MNRIESKMTTTIVGNDFEGKLHFLKLTSESQKDLLVFEFLGDIFVITSCYFSGNYKYYEEIVSMSKKKDPLLDLFYMRGQQSLSWCLPNSLNSILLNDLKQELLAN